MAKKALAEFDDLPDDRGIRVVIKGKKAALFKVGDQAYAIDALCPHSGAYLDQGYLEDGVIMCPLHAWDFDVRTGESPTFDGLCTKTFPVHVKDLHSTDRFYACMVCNL